MIISRYTAKSLATFPKVVHIPIGWNHIGALEYKTIEETAAFFHLAEKYLQIIETRALGILRDGMNDGKIL